MAGITYGQAKGRSAMRAPTRTPTWRGGTLMKHETFGVKELDKLWKDLTGGQKRNIEISAWRKASKPMLAAIKGNLSSMVGRVTGNLFKSIGSSPVKGVAILNIGARRYPFSGYHAHLVNDGTVERFTKTGASRGSVEGSNWFDLAYEATKKQIVDDYRDGRIVSFHKFVVRANNRQKSKV